MTDSRVFGEKPSLGPPVPDEPHEGAIPEHKRPLSWGTANLFLLTVLLARHSVGKLTHGSSATCYLGHWQRSS